MLFKKKKILALYFELIITFAWFWQNNLINSTNLVRSTGLVARFERGISSQQISRYYNAIVSPNEISNLKKKIVILTETWKTPEAVESWKSIPLDIYLLNNLHNCFRYLISQRRIANFSSEKVHFLKLRKLFKSSTRFFGERFVACHGTKVCFHSWLVQPKAQ